MTRATRLGLPLAIAAAWAAAGSSVFPLAISAVLGALCVVALPGLCVERLLYGTSLPFGAGAAPARWLTLSTAAIAIVGLAVSSGGGNIHHLLAVLAAASVILAALPVRSAGVAESSRASLAGAPVDAGERIARAILIAVVVIAVMLAAAAPNVARDRMWYLAFVTRLAGGNPLDWTEPFLGTGNIAARFAYNGWLLALAAWSALTGATSSIVFERLAPPLLTVATASAAWHFASRTVPGAPALAALATIVAALATRYPFFSPDRYPFFARIAEDKSVALLVFAPVALVAIAEVVVAERDNRAWNAWISLILALVAVAFGHGLVMLLLGITIASMVVLARNAGELSLRRTAIALLVATAVAVLPGRMAMLARERIVDADEPSDAWTGDATHPVVRAHLRLERTRELPLGGPIVEPRLVAHPLLLAGIGGIVFAWMRRRSIGGALLTASSVPFLALAFMPFVAPAFGRVVLPWMAYRALWMIPFGCLLALPLAGLRAGSTGTAIRSMVAVVLFALVLATMPWDRSSARPDVVSPAADPDTRAVLARIAALPADSRIAAAPGFAELIPALAGRAVLAFADRGTFVFAGSRDAAESRLRASAAIVGLAPGSPWLRRVEAVHHGVTHVVLQDRRCGHFGREVFRSGSLALCATAHRAPDATIARLGLEPYQPASAAGPTRATLGAGLACSPTPEREASLDGEILHRWEREGRWTARPVTIRCRAKLNPPAQSLSLVIVGDLPHAREVLVFRAVTRTREGETRRHHGAVTLENGKPATIALPGRNLDAVRLRLAPAYLPYSRLRELALREQRSVGE